MRRSTRRAGARIIRAARVGLMAASLWLVGEVPTQAQGWEGFVSSGVAATSGADSLDEKGTDYPISVGVLHSLFNPRLSGGVQLDVFPRNLLYGGARLGLVGQYRVLGPGRRVQPFVDAGAFATTGQPIEIGAGLDLFVARSIGFRVMVQDFFGYVVYEAFDCVYFGYGPDCRSQGIGARRAGWVHDPALQLGITWK